MFKRISGCHKIEWYPKAASTAFSNGGLVYWNGSGALIPADATSGNHAGVIIKDVVAADSDYATSGARVPVDTITADDVFEADVTGTLTTAMVGNYYDLSADGLTVDVGATSKQVVLVVGYISASKALVKVNALATNKDVATT